MLWSIFSSLKAICYTERGLQVPKCTSRRGYQPSPYNLEKRQEFVLRDQYLLLRNIKDFLNVKFSFMQWTVILFCGDSYLVNLISGMMMRNDTTWVLLSPSCVQDMILRSDNQKFWMRQQQDSYVVQVEAQQWLQYKGRNQDCCLKLLLSVSFSRVFQG